jgi:hypothetical protein
MPDHTIAYRIDESEMTIYPLQFAQFDQFGDLVNVMGFISFVFKAFCAEKFLEEVWGVESGMWMAAF